MFSLVCAYQMALLEPLAGLVCTLWWRRYLDYCLSLAFIWEILDGICVVTTGSLSAAFAAWSAASFPTITAWLGIQFMSGGRVRVTTRDCLCQSER